MTEKEKNVVLNFKMDGQVEYAKTIRDINAIMNAAASEYQTHIAAMGKDADATSKLAAEKKKLEIQLEAGKKRTEQLRTEYEALAASSKTTTSQLANKYKQLQNSERAEIALSNALEEVNEGLTEQSEESRKAEAALNKLEQESSQLESQTEKLNAEYKLQEAQLGNNATESDKLKLKMEQLNSTHELAGEKVRNYEEQLEQAKKQYGENSAEVDKYEVQLLEARTAEQQLANEIVTTNGELKKQQDVLNKTSDVLDKTGKKMKDVGKDLSMKVTAPIVGLGVVAAKSAIDFESAMAGVRKTTDLTDEEFAKLEQGILKMSKELPASASAIAGVAESAGQLGIEKENILAFSRTIIDLGEATDLTLDQAANEFSRFANIIGMSQDDFDKLGSSVVSLGNNFETTESEIVAMGMRLAAQGKQIGMSEADIMALAATMSSLGIEAESGGTAMTTVLKKIQNAVGEGGKDLDDFAKASGVNSKEFAEAWNNDPIKALDMFIKGLGASGEEGENLNTILGELGIKGIRESDAILRMAGASDILSEAVENSSNAWEENTALSDEAAERYATTAAQLAMLKNEVTILAKEIGNILIPMLLSVVDTVKPWIERFAEMDESTQKVIVVLAGLAAAIGPALMIIGSMATGASALITAFTTVSGAIAVVTTGAAAATPAIGALATAFTVLTGPVGLAIAAIVAIAAVAVTWYASFEKIEGKLGSTATVIIGLMSPVTRLATVIKLFKRGMEDAIEPVERFGEGVSESTQQAVGAFMDMAEQADKALKAVVWSQQEMNAELASNMIAGQQEVTDTLLSAIGDRHEQEKAATTEQFAQLEGLSEEQRASIIQNTEAHYAKESVAVETGNAAIADIIQTASDEKRAITQDESDAIMQIREGMTVQAVAVMSESEAEQKLIYEKMKDNAGTITALEAAEVVKNSVKKKDDVIDEAETQFTETRLWAERQRDELGTMSAEEAQAVIDEAKKKRDETVSTAEDMHTKVVEEAKVQAEEHVGHVNWETGEILSKWEVFKNNTSKKFGEIATGINEGWNKAWTWTKEKVESIRKSASDKFEEMKTALVTNFTDMVTNTRNKGSEIVTASKDKFQEVYTAIKTKLVEAVTEVATQIGKMPGKVREKGSEMKQAGKDLVLGLIGGIKDMATDAVEAITGVVGGVINKAKSLLKTASPSKVFYEIGKWTIQGEIDGMNSEKANLEKVMTDLSLMLIDITDHYAKEEIKIRNNANAEITKIEKRSKEDIAKIQRAAYAKKRKTTQDENIKIRRIQEDAVKKIATIEKKAAADSHKLLTESQKEKLKEIKLFVDDKKSMDQLSLVDEARIWEASAKLFEDGTKEKVEAQKAYQKAVEAVNKETLAIEKEFAGEMEKINKELIKQIDDLRKANEDAINKRTQSLQTFKGIFDSFDWGSGPSGHELMQNLQSQLDGFDLWQKEIEKISSKAIDEGLIAELREMGPKALPELLALNQLTDEELTKYSNMYGEKMRKAREQSEAEHVEMRLETEDRIAELRKAANKKLDELQSDWTKAIKKITQTTSDEFKSLESIGKKAGQNVLDGLSSMEASLVAKARSIASAVNSAMAGALGTSSVNTMSFDTQWNAKGGIFTQPTIFGASGGKLQGAGEAGPEAVLPLNAETLGAIGKGIAKTMGGSPITIYSRDDAESIARAVDRVERRNAYRMG